MTTVTQLFAKIASLARQDAFDRGESARLSGSLNDGGAFEIENIVNAWEAGLRQQVPDKLKHYAEEAERSADPEWQEYQRLRKKFGGK